MLLSLLCTTALRPLGHRMSYNRHVPRSPARKLATDPGVRVVAITLAVATSLLILGALALASEGNMTVVDASCINVPEVK